MSDKSTLELISEVTELNDLHDCMNDAQLDRALEAIINLIARPDIPPAKATRLIVELQALSAKFALSAALYKTWQRDKAGTDNNYKKEVYFTATDALDRLVDALKYSARYGLG